MGKQGKDPGTLRPFCFLGVNGAFKMEMETRKSKSKSSWTVTLPEGSLGGAATQKTGSAVPYRWYPRPASPAPAITILLAGQSSCMVMLKKRIVLIHLLWPVQAGSPEPEAAHWGKA